LEASRSACRVEVPARRAAPERRAPAAAAASSITASPPGTRACSQTGTTTEPVPRVHVAAGNRVSRAAPRRTAPAPTARGRARGRT
jgi:hypothetical protein